MKKINSPEPKSKEKQTKSHRRLSGTIGYADWLLEQGIAVNKEGEAVIELVNSDPNLVCKTDEEPRMDEAKEKDHNVEPSDIQPVSKMVVNEDLKSTEYKIEGTDKKPDLEKGDIKNEKPEASDLKPDY